MFKHRLRQSIFMAANLINLSIRIYLYYNEISIFSNNDNKQHVVIITITTIYYSKKGEIYRSIVV